MVDGSQARRQVSYGGEVAMREGRLAMVER
jgi:hypothetical protein